MISFKTFFKQKMAKFLLTVFALFLLIVNIAIFSTYNVQYNRESSRQQESFYEMIVHLITMEDINTAITYIEHFNHTQNIEVALYDIDGQLLYKTSSNIKDKEFTDIYDNQGNILASLLYDDYNSYLGNDLTISLIIINSLSILLFLIFLKIIFWHLNSWYSLLLKDLNQIGEPNTILNFKDLQKINNRLNESLETEARLKESQKEYVKMLAHDIKTPLTVIKANIEGIKLNRIDLNREVINDLLFEVSEIERMIPEFMKDNIDATSKKQDISVIIKDIIFRLKDVMLAKKIDIRSKLDTYFMNISYLDITRIVEHLIFNAFYYSHDNSIIEVVLDNKMKLLSIKDYGVGMSKETIKNIKTGPYRSKEAKTLHKKGSGIGLQIVQEIVRKHGFKIDFDSTLNQGTTVYINF